MGNLDTEDGVQEVERKWEGDGRRCAAGGQAQAGKQNQEHTWEHHRVTTGVSLYKKLRGTGREGTEVPKQGGNTG